MHILEEVKIFDKKDNTCLNSRPIYFHISCKNQTINLNDKKGGDYGKQETGNISVDP
ncbi:MAG: hypothetical protein US30_C0004G0066 [Candidatus Moranbacteria bacterium GW2011_GWF2_36_839]|nr:MAG: hypothetical protein US27_C0002G0069 [Candidatus Moranbacteria bacterium GW2011_GWF1_36_78]KKQ17322.1 MAG: hypothetical protein US30_C0004G0066 [Candidatus Moranbacteria bacterium GW2011_GWF2_36_839]